MKRTVLTIFLLAATLCGLMAVPAKPGVITRMLPDGSTINITLHGDEHFNYVTTEDGYLIKEMPDGFFQYAEMTAGRVTALGVRAADASQRSADVLSLLSRKGTFQMTKSEMGEMRRMKEQETYNGGETTHASSLQGTSMNLVILVNFADETYTHTQAEFDSLMNQIGYSANGATGSVKDYFMQNSYYQYMPNFAVVGPVTLDHNMSYYGAPTSDGDNDTLPAQMVLDAVRKADTLGVDFSLFDNDTNDIIDNVFIYYAGYAEAQGASSNTIWPHQWSVGIWNTDADSIDDLTFDGKLLFKYACSSELTGNTGTNMCGIGTFCHEFSHVLGLMDLYITDYSSSHKTLGYWDLMDAGNYNNDEKTPAGYSTFERFYLGWVTPQVINQPMSACISSTLSIGASTSGIVIPQTYIITSTGAFNSDVDDPNPDEYFILENRQNTSWDEYLPGHGLLVEKIKWDAISWLANVGNVDPNDMIVDIMEAGGVTSGNGDSSDPFPGTSGVTSYAPYSRYPLTNIAENTGLITFDFMGGARDTVFTVYFDGGKRGVADTTELRQDSVGAAIVLPASTPNDSAFDFVGWCTRIQADEVEYDSGEVFTPTVNTLLYAVYSFNGHIEPVEFDTCYAETFANLPGTYGVTITDMDDIADHKGWEGSLLITNGDMIEVRATTDSTKAYITTPPTGLVGDLEVFVIASHTAPAYLGVVTEDQLSSDYEFLGEDVHALYFDLDNITANSRLVISSDLNVFNIAAVYICGLQVPEPSAVESVAETGEAVLIRSEVIGGVARVENVQTGSIIRVVDIMGRVLSTEKVTSDVYEFNAPECFYMVQVECNGNVQTLK